MPLKLSPTQVAFNAQGDGSFQVPFAEQVAFLRQKLNLPTQRYDDVLRSAHDRAFVVAGALKADLLTDLHAAVSQAAAEGKSLQWFRQNFAQVVRTHGWEGWTGSESQAGRDWRTRVIYQTNLSSSYAAGRWAQLNDPELLKVRPFWKYVHNDTVLHPRPLHVSWSGRVLRHDDPWWQSHFPPNGWGCRCRVTAVSAREYDGSPAPEDGTYEKVDRFGEIHVLPKGVDYGWDYAPGARADVALRSVVQDKLINYPPALTRALTHDVNRYINAHEDVAGFVTRFMSDKQQAPETLWLGFVEKPEAIRQATGMDVTGYLVLLLSDSIHHVVRHHEWDGNGQRMAGPEDYRNLQKLLTDGEIASGTPNEITGLSRIVAKLAIGGDLLRAVFEVRTGRKNRALTLVTLAIKSIGR